jgi:hypothetical protein
MIASRPLACDPAAIPVADRQQHFKLIEHLFGELAVARERVAGGYRFRFDPNALDPITRFVENERRCCPFLRFVIEVDTSGGPIWLQMTGPDGTREFLDAELPTGAN